MTIRNSNGGSNRMEDVADTDRPRRTMSFKSEEVIINNFKASHRSPTSYSIYSTDLETAITKTGCGKYNFALLLLSFPASFTHVIDTGSMSYIIPVASDELGLTPTEKALLQSASFSGMIFSGVMWGFISDAVGRKKPLVTGYLLNALMNILAGVFPFFTVMFTFKFLSGFMICGAYPILNTYVSEVSRLKERSAAVMALGFLAAFGNVIQAGLAILIIPIEVPSGIFKSWQLFQIVCAIPALVSGIASIFLVESPKFLAGKGKNERAFKACQEIYTINTGNPSATYPVRKIRNMGRNVENKSNFSKFFTGMDIFRPPFVQKAVKVFLCYLITFCLANTLRLWLPEMLKLVSISTLDPEEGLCPLIEEGNLARSNVTSEDFEEEVFMKMMIIGLINLAGQLLFLPFSYCLQKRTVLIISILGAIVCTLLTSFTSADYFFETVSVSLTMYNISLNYMMYIVLEIFPTRIRATTISCLMLLARTGAFLTNFVMASLIYTHCQYLFYGFPGLTVVIAGLLLLIPRKPIEDIVQKEIKTPVTPT